MALVNPHGGGDLRPLLLEGDALAAERRRAETLPRVTVSSREKGDIIMLGIGGFTPLDGFMTHADWEGVCDGMKTTSGLFWPIPITLSVDAARAASIRIGEDIALVDPDDGELLATMMVTEKYGDRQGARMRDGVPDDRPEASGRQAGDGPGRGQPRRPDQGAVDRRLRRQVRRAVHDAGGDARAVHLARLVAGRRIPDAQSRCTARTSTWPRSRSRSATAC